MDILKQHFMNPQNIGTIKGCTCTSKQKSGFCGDTIEAYINIEDGIVKDVKYQACGCWALIGSASIYSEYLKGKSIEELKKSTDNDFISLLGPIPAEKDNCVRVSLSAFRNAIEKVL